MNHFGQFATIIILVLLVGNVFYWAVFKKLKFQFNWFTSFTVAGMSILCVLIPALLVYGFTHGNHVEYAEWWAIFGTAVPNVILVLIVRYKIRQHERRMNRSIKEYIKASGPWPRR